MTKSRSKDCHLILEGSAKVLLLNTRYPKDRYVLHLAELMLKEGILNFKWTPKPTKPTMDT